MQNIQCIKIYFVTTGCVSQLILAPFTLLIFRASRADKLRFTEIPTTIVVASQSLLQFLPISLEYIIRTLSMQGGGGSQSMVPDNFLKK